MKKVIITALAVMLFSAAGFATTVPAATTSTFSGAATNTVKANGNCGKRHHRKYHRRKHHRRVIKAGF